MLVAQRCREHSLPHAASQCLTRILAAAKATKALSRLQVRGTRRGRTCSKQTQNDLGGGARRGAASRRLGIGIKPSRWASLLAALRARRTASAFSRVLRSDGFSYALRLFISRKTPSRCIFFLSTLITR